MNIFQNPVKVSVVSLLLQRLVLVAIAGALTALIAATQTNPELFGGASWALVIYTILTTVRDMFNPKIPNLPK